MAAPSAPYCVTQDVALFLTMARGAKGSDFGPDTIPSDDVVNQLIGNIASRIDMAYMSVGYRIPFEAMSGETWPSAQTEFLKFINTLGVAAYMGGNVASPPVTQPGRSRSTGSVFRDEWNTIMEEISLIADYGRVPTRALLRASTYSNTGAEWRLTIGRPMTTNFSEGHYDPTEFDLFHAFTTRMKAWYEDMNLIVQTSPDFMYNPRLERSA